MAIESLLVTADHKRIGRMQIVARARCCSRSLARPAIAIRAQAAGGTIDHFNALTSLARRAGRRVRGAAAVVRYRHGRRAAPDRHQQAGVPEAVGVRAVALRRRRASWRSPRYTEHAGGVRRAAACSPPIPSPASLANCVNTKGADLLVLGMLLGAVATALMAVNLVTTISSRRAHGLTLGRLPYFAWSVLVGGIGVALAERRCSLAALALVWIDQHFGGKFFSSTGTHVFWMHTVWLGGRPEALLGSIFLLGAGSDIIATATGRKNELDMVTRAAIAAFANVLRSSCGSTAPVTPDRSWRRSPMSRPSCRCSPGGRGAARRWLAQLRHGVKPIPALAAARHRARARASPRSRSARCVLPPTSSTEPDGAHPRSRSSRLRIPGRGRRRRPRALGAEDCRRAVADRAAGLGGRRHRGRLLRCSRCPARCSAPTVRPRSHRCGRPPTATVDSRSWAPSGSESSRSVC